MQAYPALSRCELFLGFEERDIEKILSCLSPTAVRRQKGGFLLVAGEPPKLGLITKGAVQVIREDLPGRRSIIAELKAGDLFGETFCCAGLAESPVSVLCSEECEVLFPDYHKLLTPCGKACSFHGKLTENLLRILARKNLVMSSRMAVLEQRTIRERLTAYFLELSARQKSATITLPFTKSELADVLCVDRSAMTRELSKMEQEGRLKREGRRLELLSI